MKAVISLLILVLATSVARAGDETAKFESHVFQGHGGVKMPYRLLKPEKIEPGQKYPLVLVLHGWGERGTDNAKQLKDFGAAFLKPDGASDLHVTCLFRSQPGRGCSTLSSTSRLRSPKRRQPVCSWPTKCSKRR